MKAILAIFVLILLPSVTAGLIEERCKDTLLQPVDRFHRAPLGIIDNDSLDVPFHKDGVGPFKALTREAEKQNISMKPSSGFRAVAHQGRLFQEEVAIQRKSELSEQDALQKARRRVALPEYSEHHLAAIDVLHEDCKYLNCSLNRETWDFLAEYGPKYGFVVSYPEDKDCVYVYEPWHIRYVGKFTAQLYKQQGQCLNHFLQKEIPQLYADLVCVKIK